MRSKKLLLLALALSFVTAGLAAPGEAVVPSAEEARREAAIAEFTRKMKEANYPALFEAAAQEFQVPADLLKAVAFAETRWEHLTWPPGETASPETGMPRPFGIMSLWDNSYFGHSLTEAAALIGKTPDELKLDAFQNMRGGAALLRKLYQENPKPEGSAQAEVESWRYAVRKYCGIPEPDLNAQHALDVYVFMSKGYHQYGVEWAARPVNLEPIRQETARIVAEEQLKRQARLAAETNQPSHSGAELSASPRTESEAQARKLTTPLPAPQTNAPVASAPSSGLPQGWFIVGALVALVLYFLLARRKPKA